MHYLPCGLILLSLMAFINLLAPGGTVYFSSYSAKFWNWRLKWFEEQADKGLLGEIDYDRTKDGVIICKDGFKAITHSPESLKEIGDIVFSLLLKKN